MEGVDGYSIFYSHGGALSSCYGVRPIIILNARTQIEKATGTIENPHIIEV